MKCTGGSRTSDKGGGGHPDPEIRGGSLRKFFFRLFGPQFRSNNKGERKGGEGGGQVPPGPSPGSTKVKDDTNLNFFKSALTSS